MGGSALGRWICELQTLATTDSHSVATTSNAVSSRDSDPIVVAEKRLLDFAKSLEPLAHFVAPTHDMLKQA
jgi:hypothetical protein